MVIGIGTPIPDLANIPGPSRPGWPSGGGGETKFVMEIEVEPADLTFMWYTAGTGALAAGLQGRATGTHRRHAAPGQL